MTTATSPSSEYASPSAYLGSAVFLGLFTWLMGTFAASNFSSHRPGALIVIAMMVLLSLLAGYYLTLAYRAARRTSRLRGQDTE